MPGKVQAPPRLRQSRRLVSLVSSRPFQVVALDASVQMPAGGYSGCLKTEERSRWNRARRSSSTTARGSETVLETDGSGSPRDELAG